MEKKKKLIILGVILLLIVVSGATFAILTWNSTMIKLGINTNCFTIDYTRGGDITGSLKLINEEDLISNGKFTIKEGVGVSAVNIGINSNCSIEGYGKILLNVTNISDVFTTGDSKGALKYAVLKNTSTITNPTNINTTSLLNQSFDIESKGSITSSNTITLLIKQLSNAEIYKYIVVIYIDNNLAGNDITSATFSGSISSEAEQLVPTPDYCFSIYKDETNKTASITGYLCYEGNSYGYEAITDVVIPKSIDGYSITGTEVDKHGCTYTYNYPDAACAFREKQINSIIFPTTIKVIGNNAFNMNQLTSISFPDSVTEIGATAFANNQLTNVTLGNSVITIGANAFTNNQLTSITIPDSVTTIGLHAFENNQLTSVTIPDSVTTIGNNAFAYNNLNYVYIGNNSKLADISYNAFSSSNDTSSDNSAGITCVDNPNLKTIYYNGSNSLPWIYAINGSDSSTKFVTGTVPSYTRGTTIYNEVLITTGK